jgi:hypothetical protein
MTTSKKARLLAVVALALAGLVPIAAEAAILKRVHEGTTTVTSTSGNTITLELPDASKAFVVCSRRNTNSRSNARATCVLSDNSLYIDVGTATANNSVIVAWYVAEFEDGVTVQRNTAAFASGATSVAVTLPTAVDCSKSFVVMAGDQNNAANSSTNDERFTFLGILGTVASPCGVASGTTTTALTIARLDSGTAATAAWQVVTMDGATVMARGTSTIGIGSLTATATIPSTDATRSFLSLSSRVGTAAGGNEPIYLTRGDFSTCAGSPLSCTGLTFTRGLQNGNSNTQIDVAYEVVRLDDGGTVQRGTTVSSGTTTTMGGAGNISAIDRSASVPFFSASVAGNSTTFLDDGSWTVDFLSTTQLRFTRGVSVSTIGTASWFVVSFYKCLTSRLCSMSAKGGNATATISWSPLYDPQCLSGSTPTACQALVVGDASPIAWAPTNGTTYTVGTQPAGGPANMRVVFNGTGQSVLRTGLTNGITLYYRVYPRINGTTNYVTDSGMSQAISQVTVTPSATLAWSYMTTGGSTLSAPIVGNGRVYVASNGNKVAALDSSTGLEVATPVTTYGAVQSYIAWLPVSGGGEAVTAGDQDGWLTRMDGQTGLPVWRRQMPVDSGGYIQASLSAQLLAYANLGSPPCDGGAFGGAFSLDLLYVPTRNNSRTDNKVWAVPVDTDGQTTLSWTFDPAASIDRSAGQPYVDYCRNRLWVATGGGSGGTQKSIWVVDTLTGAEVTTTINDGAGVGVLGDLTSASPSLSFDLATVWVGNAAGTLFAIDAAAATPSLKASRQLTGTSPAITGFVWEDWTTPGRLYVPVTVGGSGGVWCVEDSGTSLTPCSDWTVQNPRIVTSGAVAQPLLLGTAIFFPGGDGRLYQIDTANGLLVGSGFTVQSGVALGGLSTEDGTQLFVGTSTGRTYRIDLVGGNLP